MATSDFNMFLDLLFPIIFGATFAFKLQIMHEDVYGKMTPYPNVFQHLAFLLYSVAWIMAYWLATRFTPLVSSQDLLHEFFSIVAVITSALAPYPAFEAAISVNKCLKGKNHKWKVLQYASAEKPEDEIKQAELERDVVKFFAGGFVLQFGVGIVALALSYLFR